MRTIFFAAICATLIMVGGLLPQVSSGSPRAGDSPQPSRRRPADDAAASQNSRMHPLPLRKVTIEDDFWRPKLRVYKERTIPHSWQYVEAEIRALRRAGGAFVPGEPNGTWGEANLYKVMETAAHSLALFPDPELEHRLDDIIRAIAAAQRPDGYVHAYVTNAGKKPWDPDFLDGSHDGYVLGHLVQAALAYHASTGKKMFLNVARRAADQAYDHFLGPKGSPGFDGHAELEMALIELYRVVPEQRYLDLARAFIEWRGRGKVRPVGTTPRAYFQDHVPLRAQRTLEGHAVRALFFATGVADVAIETGDCDYRLAANRFWDSTTLRRMAVTGSVGPRAEHEAFGEDYELPSAGYYESCAACGLADFAQRMNRLEGRGEAADVLERVLYNAILHGISLNGTYSYYRNPLSDHDHPRDNCWVCCPPNLSRTLFQIGRYAYGYASRDLYVNLYAGGSCTAPLAESPVRLTVQTKYPWEGVVSIQVEPEKPSHFAVHLRIPAWCEHARLELNGKAVVPFPRGEDGYVRLERRWQSGDSVKLQLEMPVQRILAHPNLRDCQGKVALQRGPIIYGLEGLDNDGDPRIELNADPGFRTEHRPDFLDGITVIQGRTAKDCPFLAIPFYALANRDKSSQEVWIVQRGLKPSTAWWEGRLYQPLHANKH